MKSANSLPQHAMVENSAAAEVGQQREDVSDGGDSAMPTRPVRGARYWMLLIYWTLRHRSLSRGRWVADYEKTP